ncbi:hypothetical protein Z946_2810 [Sulfitobacter noctilucicola]|nr:hypothetical protein Z946_2810 [Sulfitobacter noctilucicola]
MGEGARKSGRSSQKPVPFVDYVQGFACSDLNISMPCEGAILSDNDPRMAATKELRFLNTTLS